MTNKLGLRKDRLKNLNGYAKRLKNQFSPLVDERDAFNQMLMRFYLVKNGPISSKAIYALVLNAWEKHYSSLCIEPLCIDEIPALETNMVNQLMHTHNTEYWLSALQQALGDRRVLYDQRALVFKRVADFYGLKYEIEHTIHKKSYTLLGEKYGLSRERIRQIRSEFTKQFAKEIVGNLKATSNVAQKLPSIDVYLAFLRMAELLMDYGLVILR